MDQGKRFSDTYKREAVAQAEASGNVSQTARELGISDKTLHRWKQKFGSTKALDVATATSAELAVRDEQLEVLKKLSRS